MCSVWSGLVRKWTRTAAGPEWKQMHERQKSAVEVSAEVSSNKLNLLCFPWVPLDESQPWDGFTCQKWLREGQGLWEMCRRKDNKSLTVVMYFFLLQDAPRGPSVLIGSGERSRARCADVNGAWRTSAAGLIFPHPSSLFFARSLAPSPLRHLTNFCGSHLPPRCQKVTKNKFLMSEFPASLIKVLICTNRSKQPALLL